MKPLIDFDECLRDSPKFRYCVNNYHSMFVVRTNLESENKYVL